MSAAAMPLRTIGDMRVSQIALGCFAFAGDHVTGEHNGPEFAKLHAGVWGAQDDGETFATVKAALECGINFFDNAEMYGGGYAEQVTGRALKASGFARDAYYLATKVSESNLSAGLVREHVEGSIARLDCGHIDLIQLHWHSRAAVRSDAYPERPLDAEVPLEETLAALNELRREGKVRHVGVCNFGCGDLERALAIGAALAPPLPIVSNQVCYNLLWRNLEAGLLPLCRAKGVALLPWAPLASGVLTGKWASADEVPAGRARSRLFCGAGDGRRPQARHGEPGLEPLAFAAIAQFGAIAAALPEPAGVPLSTVALAWVRQQPGVTSTLMGARSVSQLRRNLLSLDLELGDQTLAALAAAGDELKRALGENLDMYEGAATSRIR